MLFSDKNSSTYHCRFLMRKGLYFAGHYSRLPINGMNAAKEAGAWERHSVIGRGRAMEQEIDVGKVWPGWKAVELIGSGSFGNVYKIVKEDFGHTYVSALKVMTIPQNQAEVVSVRNEGLDEKSVTSYFYSMVEDIVKECMLMSKLQGNSNIVSYDDHVVVPHEDGIGWDIYIRMEYLTPLCEQIRKCPMGQREVAKLGIDICRALEACGKYNIIHRDIKPENIFLSDMGHYKLGDFGVARQLERNSAGLTKTGTVTYMAPEVYFGREYNASVDLYSLGIVLYRFLNDSRTPFLPPAPEQITFEDREKATQKRFDGEEMPPPCKADGVLAKIVQKACAFDPKMRYRDAAEMRKELEEALMAYPEPDMRLKNGLKENEAEEEQTEARPADGTVVLLLQGKAFHKRQKKWEEKREPEEKETSDSGPKDAAEDVTDIEEEKQADAEECKGRPKNRKLLMVIGGTAAACFLFTALFFLNSNKDAAQDVTANAPDTQSMAVESELPEVLEVKAPDLIGLTKEQAEETLKKANFIAKEGKSKYSDTVSAGIVLSQRPKKNKMLPEGSVITYVISLGPKQAKVPKVTGLSLTEAQKALEAAGLSVRYEEAYHEEAQEGIVISQSMEEGSMADWNTEVHLAVSKGPAPQEDPEPSSGSRGQETPAASNQDQPPVQAPEQQPEAPPQAPVQAPEAPPEADWNWME